MTASGWTPAQLARRLDDHSARLDTFTRAEIALEQRFEQLDERERRLDERVKELEEDRAFLARGMAQLEQAIRVVAGANGNGDA